MWLEQTVNRDLYLSTLTFAELWQGVQRLPAGARKSDLQQWVAGELTEHFSGRIVSYTMDAARHYGLLVEKARKAGKHPETMDLLLASIALAEGMVVATLNRKDFEPLGVTLVAF